MIRMAGAMLLAAGCTGLGFAAVGQLEARARDLRDLIAGLEVVGRELGWQLAPLGELLERAARGSAGRGAEFFRMCARETACLAGRSFREIWVRSEARSGLRLAEEDRLILEQLGLVLGRYDADRQRQALSAAVGRLEEQYLQARQRRQRLGRVYGTLGAAAGALLVILLI